MDQAYNMSAPLKSHENFNKHGIKKYSAALYLRLSREDDGISESGSIVNQRRYLLDYAETMGFDIYKIYSDDGYTGTNFKRPAFLNMLDDIESGLVNMVITKDLSRLGRDYIDTGHYLERYFPKMGVRYIAVNEVRAV